VSFILALLLLLPVLSLAGMLGAGLSGARPGNGHPAGQRPDWPDRLVYGGAGAVSAGLLLAALLRLAAGGADWTLALPVGLPGQGTTLMLDALSAVFLLIVNLAGVTASLYAWGYARAEAAHGGPGPGRTLPAFPLFLLGMNLVLLADNAFTFLLAWEVMSIASWVLVLANHRQDGTGWAARVYLVMAGFGTLCLMLCFGLLAAGAGGIGFGALRAAPPSGAVLALAVVLAILGAGSKAGLVPLHVWLPLAHAAAPSPVSALMSGVMTKVALYGLIRLLFDLAGPAQTWWGALLMGLGAVTAVAGVLYALMQDDIKRLLACSTIENIGVIAVALGLALVFQAAGEGRVAAIAFAAALLHALNHSLFKTLLFYGAGAVQAASGLRALDRLGGLIGPMAVTAPLVLVGSAAGSALPPLNGFASEWLLFQAILSGPQLDDWILKPAIMVVGVLVALAAALAAAVFVRFFGIAFLGRARSAEAAAAREVNRAMLAAMAVPALLCLVIGVVPGAVLPLFAPASQALLGTALASHAGAFDWLWLAPASEPTGFGGNSYSGLAVMLVVLGLSMASAALIHARASRRTRIAPAWGCGHPDAGPAAQYTGTSFAQPLRRVFASRAFAARERVEMPEPGDTAPARLEMVSRDPAWDFLYTPLARLVPWLGGWLNRLQFLTIRRYLGFMFAALVVVLVAVAVLQ